MYYNTTYRPPIGLRSAHVQTILGASFIRSRRIHRAARDFKSASVDQLLHCSDGIQLHGYFTPRANASALVILIHGWHGHADSSYLLSCANTLWNAGYGVFRLHLRDHGPSHHLNRELFHSVRIAEVVDAVAEIRRLFPYEDCYLGGFSLGGNFAIRLALRSTAHELGLKRVFAICPVLDPANAMEALSESVIYHRYFVRKWRDALLKKLQHFPDFAYGERLRKLRNMRDMNEFFVPQYTEFGDTHSYLRAYAITGDVLAPLDVPCHIIAAEDDPVIPSVDLQRLAQSRFLTIEQTRFGGHCAFLNDYGLNTWIDQRIQQIIEAPDLTQ